MIAADCDPILSSLRAIFAPGHVVELRVPKAGRHGTIAGFFNNGKALAAAAADLSGHYPGVYVSLNPLRAELLERSPNQLAYNADRGTLARDEDVASRRWLLVDADPVRPADVSSTDAEKQSAMELAANVARVLSAAGWPEPILADSGNGAHLLYRIDLPNDAEATELVRGVLRRLDADLSTDAVKIDRKVFNASRICKVYGTVSAKGEPTPDRPHRVASILRVPASMGVVTADQLRAMQPAEPEKTKAQSQPLPAPAGISRYALAALESAAGRVSAAGPGMRNETLNTEAFGIFQLVHGGDLGKTTAWSVMEDAGDRCGLPYGEINSTLHSAFEGAGKSPRKAPAPAARKPVPAPANTNIDPETGEITTGAPANDNEDPINAMVRDWAFVASRRKFIHVPTMRVVDVDAFNLQFLHLMEQCPEVKKMKPAEYCRRIANGRVVHDLMYLPTVWNGDPFFDLDGVDYLNTYNSNSVPDAVNGWQQHDAWQICLSHIQNIMPTDWQQVLYWMAHNVQRPGRKILWAPVIVGMPGDGKTTIAKMLTSAMGSKHTQVVGPQALHSDFNGWAEGKCVTTFEEIRAKGHSRHDFMNKLKPLITNEMVDVVAKGRDSRNVVNTQNYLALSNFRDALVLDADDRRWGVFFTRFSSRAQVESEMDDAYWAKVNDYAIKEHAGVLRSWLLSIDLADFNPNRGPEMTEAKRHMIRHSLSSDAQSIAEVVGAGAYGVHHDVVETKSLNDALRSMEGRAMQTSRMSAALSELGFAKAEKTIKWNGRPCWIWTRNPFAYQDTTECRDRIREALNEHRPPSAWERES